LDTLYICFDSGLNRIDKLTLWLVIAGKLT
jgi:hypothetical protein